MWVPRFVNDRPKLFEAWFLFTNVIRYLMDGREGEACEGCFLWFPYEQLTKHVMRNGSTIPQCLECETFVGQILEGMNA